ncbi:MAG: hypothetical protein K8S55_01365 [Phycisphaerae bacterium]|nr:hypothetical protein [Phycisphaerae bacterium]
MIVPMQKVYVASRQADRDSLLNALRDLGVLHLIPVDPEEAVADEKTLGRLDSLGRAIQILESHHTEGDALDMTPQQAADETHTIHRQSVERQNRLNSLHRQMEQLELWGDMRLEAYESLVAAGVEPKFYIVPDDDLSAMTAEAVAAECVTQISQLHGKNTLLAVIQRGRDEFELPESAELVEVPTRDRPSIKAEAAEIDTALKADAEELNALANLLPAMRREHIKVHDEAEYVVAHRGGLEEGRIFAIQGWLPAAEAGDLSGKLGAVGVSAAVQNLDPDEDEEPPSLVRYPRWVKPIKALFDILGTTPGYREFDLSPFFIVAMPIFTAMLIGDGGYGLIFTLIGLLFYGKLKKAAGSPAANLLLVFGITTIVWGALSGNYFGVSPDDMSHSGSLWTPLGNLLSPLAILWRPVEQAKEGRDLIIQISFIFGTIHLVLAHLRQLIGKAPDLRALAELGWCSFLIGMLGLIWDMFFGTPAWMPAPLMIGLLAVGFALVVLFSHPSRNPVKRIGLGLVANFMPAISTFSDTMSYIRLMAVGLASYYIASTFNDLAWQVGEASPILIIASVLILLAAHALNIILCLIAIFAHGVRLNMLEFSNNAGVQWVGHPYSPFTKTAVEGDS